MDSFAAKGGWWVAGQVVLLLAAAAAWIVWGDGWGLPAVGAGLALALAGTILGGTGMLALGANLSAYPEPRPGGHLVERGPYRLVRHPIYGGILLGTVGFSLADGNWPGLVVAGALALLFWGKAGFEEARLLSGLPGYDDYRGRVRRRFLPCLI